MEKKLSKRAQKLLARLNRGDFYKCYSDRTPKAMQELIDADLVGQAMRPVLFMACYVPTKRYQGFRPEIFPGESEMGV